MSIHLINPSHVSFGIGVITPRWLYVLAQATPARFGEPIITDETLELTRYWMIPQEQRPKVYTPHPAMSPDDIRRGTQRAWDRFYNFRNIWERAHCVESLKSRLAFVLISKLYRQMYANTGIATDSARVGRSAHWARWIAKPCRRLFTAPPMPELTIPA